MTSCFPSLQPQRVTSKGRIVTGALDDDAAPAAAPAVALTGGFAIEELGHGMRRLVDARGQGLGVYARGSDPHETLRFIAPFIS